MRTLLPLLVLSLLAGFARADEADDKKKPNVLFIICDDLRMDLGCYGSPAKTPHLDRLADHGLRFDMAYCQQAVCNPSRSSFLTGQRPDSLGLWVNGTHFRDKKPDVITLPQWFKQHGYETRCAGKVFHNWHTEVKGDRRSWSADEFLHYATHGDDAPMVKGELPPNLAVKFDRMYTNVPLCERRDVPDEAYYDGRVAAEAVKVLGEIKDKPFFFAVGMWKPHAPFNAPKKYWELYDPKGLPELNPARPKNATEWAFHDSREILGIPPDQITLNDEQIREMRHGYFANVSYMDAQIGKVLKALDDNGLADNTIVIFFSDHGYHLGEHTLWAKTSCFEYDAQVPMVISTPDMKAKGQSTRSIVELVDLFPTFIDLCGLPKPEGLDGKSFAPLLNDPNQQVKPAAYTQHPRPAYPDRTPRGVPEVMGYSVRIDNFRYTEWRKWEDGEVLGAEFYDHRRDRQELNNRVDELTDTPELKAAQKALYAEFPPETPPAKRLGK